MSDLIVARNNGRIEIYSYDQESPFPQMCFESQIQSTITGIDFGNITMANSKDIILSCYDGQVLALIDSKKFKKQGIMGQEDQKEIENHKASENEKKQKITDMEKEIMELEKKLKQVQQEIVIQ